MRPVVTGLLVVSAWVAVGCGPDPNTARVEAFRQHAAQLARDAEQRDTLTVAGRDGWLFFAPELRHLAAGPFWGEHAAAVSRARNPDTVDPLPAILDFKEQLDQRGVELLVVPVPLKSAIYPDRLPAAPDLGVPLPTVDTAGRVFHAVLSEHGVEVLDLTPTFLTARTHPDGALYCRTDTHWSGVGCVIAAQRIAEVIRNRPWFAEIQGRVYATRWVDLDIQGDLRDETPRDPALTESLRVRRVGAPEAPVEPDPNSPIVVLGDSHGLVFQAGGDMHDRGAGLADQLAVELGVPVDLVAVRGSGATPARVNLLRRAQQDPDYWTRKRLVIWTFSAREFTESDGWALVPIAPG